MQTQAEGEKKKVNTTILAESRRGKKVVLLERGRGDNGREYRVSVYNRFSSLAKAQAAFLSEVPLSAADHYKAEIAEQDKLVDNRSSDL